MGGNQSQEQEISITVIVQYQHSTDHQTFKLVKFKQSTTLKELKKQYGLYEFNCEFYHAFPHSDLNEIKDQEWKKIKGGTLASHNIGNNHILNLRFYYEMDCCTKMDGCCAKHCPCCQGFPCCCVTFCGAFGPFIETGSGSETEKYLMNGDLEKINEEKVRKIVSMKNGDQMAAFQLIAEVDGLEQLNLITIRNFVDESYNRKSKEQSIIYKLNDFKYKLTKQELMNLINTSVYNKLVEIFECEPDQIIIRRCSAIGKFMDFHTDVSLKTLQVTLNDDSEYEGGKLVYASNGKLIVPKRTAGSITIHDNTIVHGVTRLENGIRYGLFFLKKR